jgi:hypothetical protein
MILMGLLSSAPSISTVHLCYLHILIQTTLRDAFNDLSSSLQRICGEVHLPPDDGRVILLCVLASNKLFVASDAAFKKGGASHA